MAYAELQRTIPLQIWPGLFYERGCLQRPTRPSNSTKGGEIQYFYTHGVASGTRRVWVPSASGRLMICASSYLIA